MRSPEFWAHDGWTAHVLAPLGSLYAAAGALRWAVTVPRRAGVPVICVGNLVAGGAGKTPVTLALLELLQRRGLCPHALIRGYGGVEAGPVRVDPRRHDYRAVGDEALLLAAQGPTWVAGDRVAGARCAVAEGAQALVMDDGFQNPGLAKDLSLLVVDGGFGFGNGRIIPAGPLREPVERGLERADAVVLLGEDHAGVAARLGAARVLRARLIPGPEAEELAGRRVLAFAGIGHPAKFFATLKALDAIVVETRAFADHHPFTEEECAALCHRARDLDAVPVTTAKDALRLPEPMLGLVRVLTVTLQWQDTSAVGHLLDRLFADE